MVIFSLRKIRGCPVRTLVAQTNGSTHLHSTRRSMSTLFARTSRSGLKLTGLNW